MSRVTAAELLAQALHAEPGDVPDDAELAITPGWDSLAHTRLILLLEDHLGRPLEAIEIVGLTCIADIAALLGGTG